MNIIKKIARVLVLIIIVLIGYYCFKKTCMLLETKEITAKREQNWIEDIEQLEKHLDNVEGVEYRFSEENRKNKINSIKQEILDNELSDVEIYFKIKELLSDIQCNHLNLFVDDNMKIKIYKELYPISGKWFGNDFYITKVREDNQNLVGGILISINGIAIEEVCKKYDSIFNDETEINFQEKFEGENFYGFSKLTLKYLKVVKSNDKIIFKIKKDNKYINCEMKPVSIYSKKSELTDYLAKNHNVPLLNESIKKGPFSYWFDEENKVMYFNYNKCMDKTHETIKEEAKNYPILSIVVDEMISCMKNNENNCTQFIIDLRNNTGGLDYLLKNALDRHISYLKNKNVKILIGKNASGGHIAVEYLLDELPNAKLYGEESSNFILNYTGNVLNGEKQMDNCKWRIEVPTYKDLGENISKRQSDWNKGIQPDYYVFQTYEDFVNGIDTVYTYAIHH